MYISLFTLHHNHLHEDYYGGYFQEEDEAAKSVNELCEELEIPPRNEIGVGAFKSPLSAKFRRKDCGVWWDRDKHTWVAEKINKAIIADERLFESGRAK